MADVLDDVFPEPETVEEAPAQQVEPEPALETVAEPAQPEVKPEPVAERGAGYVPIDAMLTEREKRQALEREVADLRKRQEPAQDAIDPFDDPTGYAEQQRQFVDERINQVRFEMSDRFARQQHGAETTDAATQWAQDKAKADPVFAASYMREPDPIGWIVQQHKRESDLSALGSMSLAEYIEAEVAKRTAGQSSATDPVTAPVVASLQPAPKAPVPPRSIASDASIASPSASSGAYNVFEGLLPR